MTVKRVLIPTILLVLFIGLESGAGAENFEYNSHGRRDPFVPLVGSERPAVTKLADITSVEDIRLEGIVSGAGGDMGAMMNGEMMKVNDKVGDIVVKSITKAAVTLTIGGKEYQLKLPEEGGQK
ncbi:MAG: hypothetical protein NTZ95_05495 [Candidatus Omnitrophica bacterium]|nr:hypothetical protein [Candidatus Omnitrophota bacterium]